MRKTTLLILFSVVTSVLSIHLPWISDATTEIPPAESVSIEEVEYSYWSFMAKKTVYKYARPIDYHSSETQYLFLNQFWRNPPSIYSLVLHQIGMMIPLDDLWQGYYVLFLFQLLTAFCLLACIVTERWDAPLQRIALYICTFLVSVGALAVAVNQYSRGWGFDGGIMLGYVGGRSLVQFDIGFYLALVSAILILVYTLSSIIRMFQE